jgi:hypothetical protein
MPRLADLGGVVIRVYFNDTGAHREPHFHAVAAAQQALVSIRTLELLAGQLDTRDWRKVRRWAKQHQALLVETWNRCNPQQPLEP